MFDPVPCYDATHHFIIVVFIAILIPMSVMMIDAFRRGTQK